LSHGLSPFAFRFVLGFLRGLLVPLYIIFRYFVPKIKLGYVHLPKLAGLCAEFADYYRDLQLPTGNEIA
jgi:hypothetical protein